eukprot:2578434-Alexandrium_andersonii.AAC.1
MSASLVGSEMCIRDRLALVPKQPLGVSSGVASMERGVEHRPDAHTAHSVSYTHLTLPTICSV